MFLDSNKKLIVVLTSAKTTLDLPINVDAVDFTASDTTLIVSAPIYTSGTTPKDVLTAPSASTIRKVNGINVYGRDTAAKGIQFYIVDQPLIAGNFTVGSTYQISAQGTTDFTAIGSTANTPGTLFTATGVGTGNGSAGTAYQQIDTTLQVDDVLHYTDTTGWRSTNANGELRGAGVTGPQGPVGPQGPSGIQAAPYQLATIIQVGYIFNGAM